MVTRLVTPCHAVWHYTKVTCCSVLAYQGLLPVTARIVMPCTVTARTCLSHVLGVTACPVLQLCYSNDCNVMSCSSKETTCVLCYSNSCYIMSYPALLQQDLLQAVLTFQGLFQHISPWLAIQSSHTHRLLNTGWPCHLISIFHV